MNNLREFWLVIWFSTERHVEICETQEQVDTLVMTINRTGRAPGVMKVREIEEAK